MKIAFFTDTYRPHINGVVENLDALAVELGRMGHEVTIVAPKESRRVKTGAKVIWLPAIGLNTDPKVSVITPKSFREIRRLFKNEFDIIHAHTGGPVGFVGLRLARSNNLPYVFTFHTLITRYTHYIASGKLITPKMVEVASKFFCNLTDVVIAPTQRVKEELLSYGVIKSIEIVPGGIDISKFGQSDKDYLREEFNIDSSEKIVLYVGRLGKEKNVSFILRAFSFLPKELKVRLVICGDGPEKESLKQFAQDLGIEDKTVFTGFISPTEVAKVYSGADIFVFASKTETQGLVIPEALASGLPVVTLKDQAYDGVVVNSYNGFMVKDDEHKFAEKVVELITDSKLSSKLGSNAKKFAKDYYSIEKQAQSVVLIYERELKKKSAEARKRVAIREVASIRNFFKINDAVSKIMSNMGFK